MYVRLRESFNLALLSFPLSFSLCLLSPQAQYNESRIDSASSCPAGEIFGFCTEARSGLGSGVLIGFWGNGRWDDWWAGGLVSRPHSGMSGEVVERFV